MRMEAPISRLKFDKEIDRIVKQRALLQKWGCFVVDSNYPCVDAIFIPKQTAILERSVKVPYHAMPRLEHIEHRSVAGRAFGVRIHLDDFNVRAPSVTFHDPWTWVPVPISNLPIGFHCDSDGYLRPVLLDDHPVFRRPFLCLPGIREYHEHPQHTDVDWFSRRNDFGVFTILEIIADTCCSMSRPRISFPAPQTAKIDWVGCKI